MSVQESLRDQAVGAELQLLQAQVYAVDKARYGVVHAGGCYWLSIATSCLLQPEVGDLVLVSQNEQEGFILAILTRPKAQQSTVRLPNHSRIQMASGCLHIESAQGMSIHAGDKLVVQAQVQQQFFESRLTRISGHDELSAQSQRLVLAKEWRVRSKTAEVRAEQRVTLDAERVQLG